jgi:competence protein ComEC
MPAVSKLPSPSLRTVPQAHRSSFLLEVTQLDLGPWQPCSGKLKVWVEERLDQVRLGDEIEIVGLLLPWTLPGNPGERSLAEVGTDQGVFAGLIVKTADGIVVRATGSPWKKETWLNQLHASATATLQRHLPPELTGVGQALVLGDEAALEQPQMESYMRTGVFHVLAVSGQHLTVLCLFLQPVLTLFRLRRRPRAVVLILLVIGYALLTGNRPPMMRAAVMVCTACGGLLLLRKPQPLNSLLLAWVLLAVGNPGDLFGVGCQLSFLAVLILVQCWGPWRAKAEVELPPLDRLERDLAPPWRKCLRWVGNWLYWSWAASLVIWLLSLPLLACRFHLVSPVAVLLGPFLVLLASIALVAGFLLVLAGMIHETLAWLPAWVMKTALLLAQGLIDFCQQIPGAYWYCADLPAWWVAGFYLHVLLVLVWPQLGRWWRWHLLVGGCWFLVLYLPPRSAPVAEVRCTILSVGHGSCAVIETPQGQVFLYDTGSMSGPEAATRSIAPFLWSRGYTQIDEVFLSHADLDHFNGLPALMQRFRIAQISLTPTFREKPIRGVQTVLAEWEQRHIPVRVLTAPQTLHAGTLEIQVLHPPAQGPTGNENARSMVLRLGYQGQTLLLTGDLEGEGLRQVMGLSLSPPDVLVAPHHGSPASNTPTFAQWAAAKLVISSEGNPHYFRPDPYSERGAVLWRTWKEGAVTVRLSRQGIVAETYRTKQRWEKTVLATPR